MPGRVWARLGWRSKTFCASWCPSDPALFPSIKPWVALTSWYLTCAQGSHEHPAPQKGKWCHSLASGVLSDRAAGQVAVGQGQPGRSTGPWPVRWQRVADTLWAWNSKGSGFSRKHNVFLLFSLKLKPQTGERFLHMAPTLTHMHAHVPTVTGVFTHWLWTPSCVPECPKTVLLNCASNLSRN